MKNVCFDKVEDILIASVSGEIDHHNAAFLRNEIDLELMASGCRNLIIDYTGVEFMDSSGIGLAMGRYRKVAKRRGKMVIVPGSGYVNRMFSLAGIFSAIPKSRDSKAAAEYLISGERGGIEVEE